MRTPEEAATGDNVAFTYTAICRFLTQTADVSLRQRDSGDLALRTPIPDSNQNR